MADYDDLRKLAEAAQERQQPGTLYSPRSAGDDYIAAANPARVLALLDELEDTRRLYNNCRQNLKYWRAKSGSVEVNMDALRAPNPWNGSSE